jgi:molybdopterin synthase catalytic subunit
MMQLRILSFGRLRDLLSAESRVELPSGSTVGGLWQRLKGQHSELAAYEGSLAIAVNQQFAVHDTVLKDGDEVALLPPVSGGRADDQDGVPRNNAAALPLRTQHATLQREPLDSAALMAACRAGEDGAAILFDGMVRNNTRGRRTLYLEYESYPAMAVAEMERLAVEALSKFAIRDVRLVHRVGRLEIGESSVVIVVASAHRAAAFEACRWLIDSLKKTVPVWKREFFSDGAEWAAGDPFPPEVTPGAGR